MAITEDYSKYWMALAARSIRRAAAEINTHAIDNDAGRRALAELVQALMFQRHSVLVGWPNDHVRFEDDGDEFVEIDLGTYSSGEPVYTTVEWSEGFATVVHPPSPGFGTEDPSLLVAEYWPCHRRRHGDGEISHEQVGA